MGRRGICFSPFLPRSVASRSQPVEEILTYPSTRKTGVCRGLGCSHRMTTRRGKGPQVSRKAWGDLSYRLQTNHIAPKTNKKVTASQDDNVPVTVGPSQKKSADPTTTRSRRLANWDAGLSSEVVPSHTESTLTRSQSVPWVSFAHTSPRVRASFSCEHFLRKIA